MEVKELETIFYKDEEYFVDNQLHEFRPIKPPFRTIPFDSDKGDDIFESLDKEIPDIYRVTCKECGSVYKIELILIGKGAEKLPQEYCHYCRSEEINIINLSPANTSVKEHPGKSKSVLK